MLLLEFWIASCLIVSAKGFTIDYDYQYSSFDDSKYELDNYDVIQWDLKSNNGNQHNHFHHDQGHDENTTDTIEEENFDSWSIVWYIASFGGLIAFFLVVSCSEWCCRKHIRDNQLATVSPTAPSMSPESPPPAYDLFAPPSYESLHTPLTNEKTEYDIYVVPVHAIGSLVENTNTRQEEHPPSYLSISDETTDTRTSSTT